MTDEQIRRLRELKARGTPGEWSPCGCRFSIGCAGFSDKETIDIFETGIAGAVSVEQATTDNQLICEAVNALPALLDEVERLRARCERLEKVREAAEALCEQVEYVKYYTADSTALSAIRSALAAALEGE